MAAFLFLNEFFPKSIVRHHLGPGCLVNLVILFISSHVLNMDFNVLAKTSDHSGKECIGISEVYKLTLEITLASRHFSQKKNTH